MKKILTLLGILLLSACTTPFHPPVTVRDSKPFAGMAQLLAESPNKQLDVILIHGMCTHNRQWAVNTINIMAKAADQAYIPLPAPTDKAAPSGQEIEVVTATTKVGGGTIRFNALIWSGLTAPLKQLLAYDDTGTPTNCAVDAECKPQRASVNGKLKDTLLNDCLSDAIIYQGDSKDVIGKALVAAITNVMEDKAKAGRDDGAAVPLVLVAESLGSKMTFDALNSMLQNEETRGKRAANTLADRIATLYMAANQLPLLSLAERATRLALENKQMRRTDSLSQFLDQLPKRRSIVRPLTLVAFTDPNDLLSYLLLPAHYDSSKVAIANVLVSNDKTYFGLLENPYAAHTGYLQNADVAQAIVCGLPDGGHCK
ncbi:hypothetical protein ACFOLJ_26195 [Rugamonas sp. CCM 8940]|uniref:hypothetical protein n=1 Tax=Rugamonas sp. CCM 8940 TaxID=2765359 RepID=UPI0018F5F50E|nr:hypothetical protein [Rugamonas sp. CCM 8940]MBJ7310030.1 hypothetical protein [Rugamonas sp. CCM 8940]